MHTSVGRYVFIFNINALIYYNWLAVVYTFWDTCCKHVSHCKMLLRYNKYPAEKSDPCMDKTWWPAGQKESHNNSGICAKEQEELSVCCLRYPLFLLFVQEWSLVPAARKPVISAPEQANNTISKSRDGQTSPTHLLLTGSSHDFIGSLYPSIHRCPP